MSKLPDTLVLVATVHGGIPVDSGKVARLFKVPQGIQITRIMTARPGVCNVLWEDRANQIVKDMNQTFKDVTPEEINTIVEGMSATMPGVVKRIESRLREGTPYAAQFQQFIRSHIKTPAVETFLPGEPLIDKEFYRGRGQGTESAYDSKLVMINVPGNPDFFDEMIFGRTGPSIARKSASSSVEADLSTVVGNLRARGVKHLVFFDFTCSSFEGKLTNRDERILRRDIVKRGTGRRTHRVKRKRTTRRR